MQISSGLQEGTVIRETVMAAGMEGGCDGTSVKGSPGLHLNPSQKAQAVAMASLQHLARFGGGGDSPDQLSRDLGVQWQGHHC